VIFTLLLELTISGPALAWASNGSVIVDILRRSKKNWRVRKLVLDSFTI
jgi:hypothetical protein